MSDDGIDEFNMSSGDERTIYTASDAMVCKYSAVISGYYSDPFIQTLFSKNIIRRNHNSLIGSPGSSVKKPPIINRGYYARVKSIDDVLCKFLSSSTCDTVDSTTHVSTPSIELIDQTPIDKLDQLPSSPLANAPTSSATAAASTIAASTKRQIVNLGCGFDTLSLRYLEQKHAGLKIFEVDFQEVITKKALALLSEESICNVISSSTHLPSSSSTVMPSVIKSIVSPSKLSLMHGKMMEILSPYKIPNGFKLGDTYTLLALDLRSSDGSDDIITALVSSGLDITIPTIIITECVMVYIDKVYTDRLVSQFSQLYDAAWITYDMINPTDAFGRTMSSNLKLAGFQVPGFHYCPSNASLENRFTEIGAWEESVSLTMLQVYNKFLTKEDAHRIGSLELFDEMEEWEMIMNHYALTVAVKGDKLKSLLTLMN